MIPIILVANQESEIKKFLLTFKADNKIEDANILRFLPEKKEFSITQIREIKKNIVLTHTATHLYILYDFDKASYEAQNAFLKTLEECNENNCFLMIVENPYSLLPTIISRSKTINIAKQNISADDDDIGKIDQMIMLYKQKLIADKQASQILKELLHVRNLILSNHVDKKLALDHILILTKQSIVK